MPLAQKIPLPSTVELKEDAVNLQNSLGTRFSDLFELTEYDMTRVGAGGLWIKDIFKFITKYVPRGNREPDCRQWIDSLLDPVLQAFLETKMQHLKKSGGHSTFLHRDNARSKVP